MGSTMPRRRPNILLLMADQMRWDCLGSLNPAIRTPHLDRLAREGANATAAYAPTPVCLPCRASVLTGQYASTHGAAHNFCTLPEDYDGLLPHVLRQVGYRTTMIGKSHFSNCHDPASLESAPHIHNRHYFRRWHGPWYGFEHAELSIGHTVERHACGMHYGAWLEDRGVDLRKYFGNHEYTAYGPWDLPVELHQGQWVADRTNAAIDAAQADDRPFLIWANFGDPHNPCMVPEPWASLYDPATIPRFGFKPGEPACFADKPAFYRELLEQPGAYACKPSDPDLPGAGNVCSLDWTPEQVQANAACYYGMVSLMDQQIGGILGHLDRLGLAEDTLVVFTADHGDLLGDHGLWWKSLVAYEESIRVPFLARMPGTIPGGVRPAAPLSLIDLLPTFARAGGAVTPAGCEGVDQMTALAGGAPARPDVVIEERPHNTGWAQRILIRDGWKLVWQAGRDHGELYDMQADPHHVRNRWDDPAQAGRRQAMISRILTHETTRRLPRLGPSHQLAWDAGLGLTRPPKIDQPIL
jgi:arylsulfatase A-like enzyme